MAQYFKKVLGDTLLTKPVDIAADGLPSPNQLKRKILIKVGVMGRGGSLPVRLHGHHASCRSRPGEEWQPQDWGSAAMSCPPTPHSTRSWLKAAPTRRCPRR